MNAIKYLIILNLSAMLMAACPDGFYEDECGDCWLPYCYDYMTHSVSYDTEESECNAATEISSCCRAYIPSTAALAPAKVVRVGTE